MDFGRWSSAVTARSGNGCLLPPSRCERHDAILSSLRTGEDAPEVPLPHDCDPVAHAKKLRKLGGDHQYSVPARGEIIYQIINLIFHTDIDSRRGLVENHYARLREEPARQNDFLPVPPAQM